MASFAWPSVFVLKGSKIVVDRSSWKLVSNIVVSSNEGMVEPAPLDAPKSATQIRRN